MQSAGTECGCGGTTVDSGPGCVSTSSGSSGGNGQCTSTSSEMCNGKSYTVTCSCPQAKCVCFGDTTTIIDYPDCPYCSNFGSGPGLTDSQLFSLCNFPQ
jgi:hypothetical protein